MADVTVPYLEGLLKDLADPEEAAAYLNAALEDGDQRVFMLALRHVAEARGISQVARETQLNRENMYRILSPTGNPQLSSLTSLLRGVGLRLSIDVESQYRASDTPAVLAENGPAFESEGD